MLMGDASELATERFSITDSALTISLRYVAQRTKKYVFDYIDIDTRDARAWPVMKLLKGLFLRKRNDTRLKFLHNVSKLSRTVTWNILELFLILIQKPYCNSLLNFHVILGGFNQRKIKKKSILFDFYIFDENFQA